MVIPIKYKKTLKGISSNKIDLKAIRDLLLNEGAESVVVEEGIVKFTTKGVFGYNDFHLFAFVNYGVIDIKAIKNGTLIRYNIYSKHMIIFSILSSLLIYLVYGSILFSIIILIFSFGLMLLITESKHKSFFENIIDRGIGK